MRLAGYRTWGVLILLVCLTAGVLSGAVEDLEGRPVGTVVFDPKQQPIPPLELVALLPFKKNQPFRLSDAREAIGRLYATGRYTDIVVDATLQDGQVAIRFLTTGAWFTGNVAVSGVPSPPGIGQLVNATNLTLGFPFYEEDLGRATENLSRVLSANGFFKPKIDYLVTREARTQQVHVRFNVEPGDRARFGPPVITGELKRPVSEIVSATHWKGWFGWHRLTESRVQNGLERILRFYREKNFLMARATLESIDPQSGSPALEVIAGPTVLIEAKGAEVSSGRLRRLLPVFEEQSIDRDLLLEGARDLTEYFQTQGYFDAKVDFASEPERNGQLRIEYTIDRGERYKLAHVEIKGNRYFDTKTLRERMLVAPASFQLRRGRYSVHLLERDLDAISELYRTNGFRDVKATSEVTTNYRGRGGDVAVSIQIQEGDQWFVSNLEFEGVSPENEQAIRPMLQSSPGQPFSEANVASDRDNILAHYYNLGYPSASFEWSFKEAQEPKRAELTYVLVEGSRNFVREVLISGLHTTHPQLVNRRIGINVGDPISQAQMLATQRRLYDLGIFAKVDMALQNPDGEERDKYVLLQAEESRRYSVTAGFGAEIARIGGNQTSLESPAGEADFSPRVSFDFSRLNFLGRAHTVSLRTSISNLKQRGLVTYLAPQFQGHENLDLSFSALFDSSRDVRTFSSRRWEGSTQLTHRWTRSRTLFYRAAYRRVSIDQGTLKIRQELIPLLSQPVRVGVLSAAYVDDRRDDPTDSRRGTYNSLDIGTASKYFGSETDYFRLLGRNSTYHRLGSKLVLARTLSFGMMQTLRTVPGLPPSPQDIPLPERFFAGGASTQRAFPENQAGPRDPVTGFPLGGKALLMIGTEIRFPLLGQNIGGVLFHDAGNVYTALQDISFRVRQRNKADFDYMVHAVGFGVRYRTPVGPVRIDLSFGPNSPRFVGCQGTQQELIQSGTCVTKDQRINRFQFHFSLGQTF